MKTSDLGTVTGVNDTIFGLVLAGDEVIVGSKFIEFCEVKTPPAWPAGE